MIKKKRSEADIQLSILQELKRQGKFCWRNQPVTFNHQLGFHISNPYVPKGMPDILCCIDSQLVGIEVKTPKGKQSPDQILFQKRLELSGGKYVLAKSVADIKDI